MYSDGGKVRIENERQGAGGIVSRDQLVLDFEHNLAADETADPEDSLIASPDRSVVQVTFDLQNVIDSVAINPKL